VSAQIADVSPTCRLLFVGMWLFCDDAGIHPASPRQLKMEVFPGDDISASDVRQMIDDLIRVGLIVEYDVTDGTQVAKYWQVTGWHHQKIALAASCSWEFHATSSSAFGTNGLPPDCLNRNAVP